MSEGHENTLKPKRELGWDLWRFLGCFLIFVGHNGLAFQLCENYNAVEMTSKSVLGVLSSPVDAVQFLLYTCVPVFLFISGYFTLSRPVDPEKDWKKAKGGFWKYIRHYWKWLTVSAVLLLIMAVTGGPDSVAGMFMAESLTWPELIAGIVKNYVNMNLLDYGATLMVALNWFFVVMAWLMLLTPFLKYLVQTKYLKMIRALTLVLLVFSCVTPTVRYIFSYLAEMQSGPVTGFLAVFAPFYTSADMGFNMVNAFIPMYLAGGLFAVDEELKDKLRSLSWTKALLIFAGLFTVQVFVQYFADMIPAVNGNTLSFYGHIGWLPMALGWILLAYKLNFVINEDSKLGRFIIGWAPDTLGVMTAGWFFGPYILSAPCLPILDAMILALWNPANPLLFTLAMMGFYLLYFIVIFVLVHLLKKVPVVRRLFMFPGEKAPNRKRKEKADAQAA